MPCLVVLVGPSGSGKTAWADDNFRQGQVVSSDRIRAAVGEGADDQKASADAFQVLDLIVSKRLGRRLTTVVDTLGLDAELRAAWISAATQAGMPCFAVSFDTPAKVCRERNKRRRHPVPARVIDGQIRRWAEVDAGLDDEGFAGVYRPEPVELVPTAFAGAAKAAEAQHDDPRPLRFGLQIPSFTWPGGPEEIGSRLSAVAVAAEEAGFASIWVMDHFLQIPQVGREWDDMLDSYTTLGFLANATTDIRLGVLVTGITYRNVAHLGKIVATLDVLSGGRAICGLGAAWFEREHRVYGWEFPAVSARFDLLEDALQLLPLMWGPGSPSFEGKVLSVPEAVCYPRPIQEKVPMIVGGGGERRTLRLVARYADGCNLFGDEATIRHKLDVVHRHCEDVGRDPGAIEVTHLSTVLSAHDRDSLAGAVEALRPRSVGAERYAAQVNAGTITDHVGRFRSLADAGVETAIVNMPDLAGPEPVERFGEVVAAFSQ